MTYLRPHNSPGKRRARAFAAIGGILLAALALVMWLMPRAVPGFFTALVAPFWRTEFAIDAGALRSPEQLMAENEALKRRLAEWQLAYASSTQQLLAIENSELRSILGRSTTTPALKLAAVLARPSALPYDELIIDLGSADGVAADELVAAPGNVEIGRIVRALGRTSTVRLFSSPGQKYEVTIGPSHVPATAIGRGGGYYEAKVPHGSAIQMGDAVAGSSAASATAFGTVTSVVTDPADPFDTILFAPPVNIFELRWVLVDTAHTQHE